MPITKAITLENVGEIAGVLVSGTNGIIVRFWTMTSGPRVTLSSAAARGFVCMPPLCGGTVDRIGHGLAIGAKVGRMTGLVTGAR